MKGCTKKRENEGWHE